MNTRVAIGLAVGGVLLLMNRNVVQQVTQLVRDRGDDFAKLHPEVQWRYLELVNRMNARLKQLGKPYEVALFDGHRPIGAQQQEMLEGDSWLSDALNGYHVWGLAVDVVFKRNDNGEWTWLEIDGKPGPDFDLWHELGAIGESLGFEWGGRWKRFDGPHFQYPFPRTSMLKQQYGTPDQFFKAVEQGLA